MGPQKLGDTGAPAYWDVGVADPVEICFCPAVLPCHITCRPITPLCQLWMVTGINTDRLATYDFLL